MRRWILMLCLCCHCAGLATAAIITVDTNADDTVVNGNCTLREAVIAANTNVAVDQCNDGDPSGTDLVLVVPPLDSIQLSQGQIQVTEQVTITGPGANGLTIGSNSRVFVVNMDSPDDDFKLQNVNLTGAGSAAAW